MAENDSKHVLTMNAFVNLSFTRDNVVKNPLKSSSCCVIKQFFRSITNSNLACCLIFFKDDAGTNKVLKFIVTRKRLLKKVCTASNKHIF